MEKTGLIREVYDSVESVNYTNYFGGTIWNIN